MTDRTRMRAAAAESAALAAATEATTTTASPTRRLAAPPPPPQQLQPLPGYFLVEKVLDVRKALTPDGRLRPVATGAGGAVVAAVDWRIKWLGFDDPKDVTWEPNENVPVEIRLEAVNCFRRQLSEARVRRGDVAPGAAPQDFDFWAERKKLSRGFRPYVVAPPAATPFSVAPVAVTPTGAVTDVQDAATAAAIAHAVTAVIASSSSAAVASGTAAVSGAAAAAHSSPSKKRKSAVKAEPPPAGAAASTPTCSKRTRTAPAAGGAVAAVTPLQPLAHGRAVKREAAAGAASDSPPHAGSAHAASQRPYVPPETAEPPLPAAPEFGALLRRFAEWADGATPLPVAAADDEKRARGRAALRAKRSARQQHRTARARVSPPPLLAPATATGAAASGSMVDADDAPFAPAAPLPTPTAAPATAAARTVRDRYLVCVAAATAAADDDGGATPTADAAAAALREHWFVVPFGPDRTVGEMRAQVEAQARQHPLLAARFSPDSGAPLRVTELRKRQRSVRVSFATASSARTAAKAALNPQLAGGEGLSLSDRDRLRDVCQPLRNDVLYAVCGTERVTGAELLRRRAAAAAAAGAGATLT